MFCIPRRTLFALYLLLLLLGLSARGALAQEQKPTPIPAGQAFAPQSGDATELSNQYLRVIFNADGRFRIETTGGNPEIVGDEDRPLTFTGFTSFSTFRYSVRRVLGTLYYPMKVHTMTVLSQEVKNDCLVEGGECYVKTRYRGFFPCGYIVTQHVSFRVNPFTGRKDMVRIRYSDRGIEMSDTPIGTGPCMDTEFFPPNQYTYYRIMLDTQIGENDEAPFYVSGEGYLDKEKSWTNDIPEFFRAFESDEFAPDSLQAIGIIWEPDLVDVNLPARFTIANWGRIRTEDWAYNENPNLLHGDSAIAVYSESIADRGSQSYEFSYGLAPAVAGPAWTDTPETISQNNQVSSHVSVVNTTEDVWRNGTATVTLPPGLVLQSGATASSSEAAAHTIGDLAPGASHTFRWPLQVTGGAGLYTFVTQLAFASGESFSITDTVRLAQGVHFSQLEYHAWESDGTAIISVARTNSTNTPLAVTYTTAEDTAKAGTDFVATTGVLNFAAGETSKTFTIPLVVDATAEGEEHLLLSLTTTAPNTVISDRGEIRLIISGDVPVLPVYLPRITR